MLEATLAEIDPGHTQDIHERDLAQRLWDAYDLTAMAAGPDELVARIADALAPDAEEQTGMEELLAEWKRREARGEHHETAGI